MNMCRFSNPEDPGYLKASSEIRTMMSSFTEGWHTSEDGSAQIKRFPINIDA
jgi:hypothetical protein